MIINPYLDTSDPSDEFDGSVLSSKWSWLNQSGATTSVSGGVLTMGHTTAAGGQTAVLVQNNTAVGDWTYTMKFTIPATTGGNNYYLGLALYNNSTTRSILNMTGTLSSSGAGFVQRRLGTAFSANQATWAQNGGFTGYARTKKVGTSYYFETSLDNITYTPRYNELASAYLGTADKVGISISSPNVAQTAAVIDWFKKT